MGMYRVISSRHVFKPHINGISYFSSNYRSQNSKVPVVICSSFLLGRVRSVSILMKHSFLVPMTDAVCTTFCVYSGIPLFSRVMIKKIINCQGIESLRWVRALASHRCPASYMDKNSLPLSPKPWRMWWGDVVRISFHAPSSLIGAGWGERESFFHSSGFFLTWCQPLYRRNVTPEQNCRDAALEFYGTVIYFQNVYCSCSM